MCKLSIIVPIYNVDKYISRCIESILDQDYKDIEVLLIDDGSSDQSGTIIDNYSRNDSRIIVIHKQNGGVSSARNLGLKYANGDYVGFVDADDWIEPNMYSTLINALEQDDTDISSCVWIDEKEGNSINRQASISSTTMTREEYVGHLFDLPPTISGSACLKLFRRKLIKELFSNEHIICEDNLFVTQYCLSIRRASFINLPLYHVFVRADSSIRNQAGIIAFGLSARRKCIDTAREISPKCGMMAEQMYLDQCITYCQSNQGYLPQYRDFAINEYLMYIKEHGNSVMKNQTMSLKLRFFYLLQYIKLKSDLMVK